jgi:hypothetical protein
MLAAALALIRLVAPASQDTGLVRVTVRPSPVYLEPGDEQELNFDFEVENRSADTVSLRSIVLTVRDRSARFARRRCIDDGGLSPAILAILPERVFPPGARGLFFNPLPRFPPRNGARLARVPARIRPGHR